jgi:hypothetical protein
VKHLWNDLWIPQIGFSTGVLKSWSKGLYNMFFGDGANVTNPTIKQQIVLPKAQ